ncbi:hypothetical protein OG233_14080 [Streptomyces sp. NBC_01218]|uniref:hypothetical protein n=1 Tax=Streptomyces sp. NBC_01218 TaxID=2903780 RepID=UPI002E11EA3E|nr:hypothetical protein OG233_14080 [Streptomyces sp. NBC_01218]
MTRGGARAASGPAPDPNALRRNRPSDKAGWRTLPTEGRPGDPPQWPLTTVSDREWELWADLWESPQAVMWDELGQTLEVALAVRTLAEAELPDARIDIKKMVRPYLDSLGLTVQGMLRNRWKIAPATEQDAGGTELRPAAPLRPGPRNRLKVVRDDEGT